MLLCLFEKRLKTLGLVLFFGKALIASLAICVEIKFIV